jgi:hypothetical protein
MSGGLSTTVQHHEAFVRPTRHAEVVFTHANLHRRIVLGVLDPSFTIPHAAHAMHRSFHVHLV